MSELLGDMLDEAATAVSLRRVDLDAFDRKLVELESQSGKAASATLNRLQDRRVDLEGEISGLEKHVDDFRFLAGSLEKLRNESTRRDELQEQALGQLKEIEEARGDLAVRAQQLQRSNQDLNAVLAVVIGVDIQLPEGQATAPAEPAAAAPRPKKSSGATRQVVSEMGDLRHDLATPDLTEEMPLDGPLEGVQHMPKLPTDDESDDVDFD